MALLGAKPERLCVRKIGTDEFLPRFGRRVILKFVGKNLLVHILISFL